VEAQFLASDLRDSTKHRTAIPTNFNQIANGRLKGPFLVQIMAITDIGHSAFSLQNTRQIRLERADMSALEVAAESDGEDEGPVPNYPRGMLRLELSDGSTVFPAIEYRKISELALGVTPLGCKVTNLNLFSTSAETLIALLAGSEEHTGSKRNRLP
jgi:RecQ-mediated genome instability protein 1